MARISRSGSADQGRYQGGDRLAFADRAEDLRTVRHLASTASQALVGLAKNTRFSPIPWLGAIQSAGLKFRDGGYVFRGETYNVFLHRQLPESAKIGCGSFSEDSRGRWYINVPVEVAEATQAVNSRVGIDLGTKALARLSVGDKIAMPAFYRNSEAKLATSQRARKSKRVKAIHAKIRNRR